VPTKLDRARLAASKRIDAPQARPSRGDIEPEEAEQDGWCAAFENRPEPLRSVPDEIGHIYTQFFNEKAAPTQVRLVTFAIDCCV